MQPRISCELLHDEIRDIGSGDGAAVDARQVRQCLDMTTRRLVVEHRRPDNGPVDCTGSDRIFLTVLVFMYPCGENRGLDTRPGHSTGSRSAPFRRKRVNGMGELIHIGGLGIKGTTDSLPGLRVAVVFRVAHDLEEFLVR